MRILLVEDNGGDARLVVEALKECDVPTTVTIVNDGLQVMAYLQHEEPYQQAVHPDVILLDLNLPRKDGREVLQEIKTDPALKTIPVIILTSSEADEDVLSTYANGASCYVVKPMALTEYFGVIRDLVAFWGTRVRLPVVA